MRITALMMSRPRSAWMASTTGQAPAFHFVEALALETLQPLLLLGHRADILLEHDLLGPRRADDLQQPTEMGGGPVGSSLVVNVLAQQKGFQAVLRGLEVSHGVLAPSTQVPNGFVLDPRDVDRLEITAAHQASKRDRVAAVRLHAVAGLSRNERRRDHVTAEALSGEVAIQPIAARAGLIDEDERRTFRLELANQLVDVGLARADRTQRGDLRAALVRRVGYGDGFLVTIETNEERLLDSPMADLHARLCLEHVAALASMRLIRVEWRRSASSRKSYCLDCSDDSFAQRAKETIGL
jgi:hypothetical protein